MWPLDQLPSVLCYSEQFCSSNTYHVINRITVSQIPKEIQNISQDSQDIRQEQ